MAAFLAGLKPSKNQASATNTARGSVSLRVAYLDGAWGRAEQAPAPMLAVDRGPWRGILGHRRFRGQPSLELFDHQSDPAEQYDLAARRSDAARSTT